MNLLRINPKYIFSIKYCTNVFSLNIFYYLFTLIILPQVIVLFFVRNLFITFTNNFALSLNRISNQHKYVWFLFLTRFHWKVYNKINNNKLRFYFLNIEFVSLILNLILWCGAILFFPPSYLINYLYLIPKANSHFLALHRQLLHYVYLNYC